MKKYLFAFTLITSGQLSVQAQLKVIHYEMEQVNTYALQGFTPSSTAAFYSKKSGGKLMMNMPVDQQGKLLLQAEQNFKPAFVLNAGSKEREGSRKVFFIEDKEFTLNRLTLKGKKLSFQAATLQPGTYLFEMQRSENGAAYSSVQSFTVYNGKEQEFTYTELAKGNFSYRIRVSAAEDNFEVFSRILSADLQEAVVYPNPCIDRLHLATDGNWDMFVVRNSIGQVSKKGKSNELQGGWIDMSDLQTGHYVIETLSGNTSVTKTSFLKQ
ncbi:MAG: T9SS type A sorting domain-containing protein [Chitinophagaceae bacterium]|nr:T9SS type A sorting domain-containing protein [Chitinophagaceae bacterium]